MQKKIEIEIPEAVTNMIWRLDTDRHGYQNIITYILTHSNINISNELLEKYQKEYLDTNYAFEIAKQEIAKKYIYENYPELKKYQWSLDYATNIITIFLKEKYYNENT